MNKLLNDRYDQVVEITPSALANIGYRTYIIFAVLNIANAFIVWCFYPETAGQTLESIDRIFAKDDDDILDRGKEKWYRKLQWEMVGRSARMKDLRRRTESQRGSPVSVITEDEEVVETLDERVERAGI